MRRSVSLHILHVAALHPFAHTVLRLAYSPPSLKNNPLMYVKTGSMNDIGKVRIELCKMNCRVHMKLPVIQRTGDSLEFHTCCDDFKKRLEARFEELMATPAKPTSAAHRH